jgi:predicted nucleotidyltransferase
VRQVQEAINNTIEYGCRFGVKYTRSDIKQSLISGTVFEEKEIEKVLELQKVKSKKLKVKTKIQKTKIKKAEELAELIGKYFKSILLITITGSVAAGYPEENSDIDLMIITKRNRLWLTRLILRLFIVLNRIPHRRYGQKEYRDEFCFNLWLEEDNLFLPKNKQNLRNAMDSILMIPIINKSQTYERFMRENMWISKFIATSYSKRITNYELRITNYKSNNIFDLLNWLVFWPQWWYMKNKINNELVDIRSAFFHPNDRIGCASKNNP